MKVLVNYTITIETEIEIDDKFQALADPENCPNEGLLSQELVNLVVNQFSAMPNSVTAVETDELLLEI